MQHHYVRKHRKQKNYLKVVIPLLVFLLIVFTPYYFIYSPADGTEQKVIFTINSGDTVKEIAAALKAENLIKSENAFYLYSKYSDLANDIIAGNFTLNTSMSVPEILETFTKEPSNQIALTIQEGLTVKQIDQKIADLGLAEPGSFIKATQDFQDWDKYSFLNQETQKSLEIPLEGFIYPDTYFIQPDAFDSNAFIKRTLDNFEVKFAQINPENNYSILENITMASIIESEVFGYEDRQLVSGILWKRLENDWTIGADATILYITDDRQITASDLKIDSPYNTRKNLGLPPGPISNPSIESITTAYTPKNSDYWFYLTTLDTGEVIYAKTNDEHNLNRVKYLQ